MTELSRDRLRGMRVVVLGLGETGSAVARTLAGWGAVVSASDDRPDVSIPDGIEGAAGSHELSEDRIAHADIVVVSPGLAPHEPIVERAMASDALVCSDIELASRVTDVPIVAVTGTNGKTSTCELVTDALTRDGRRAVACGNEHVPFLAAVDRERDAEVFVVEASSFALAYTSTFRPVVAVVTNLAPDHFDWHRTFEHYRDSKARIASRQEVGDTFVYPAEQPDVAAFAAAGVRTIAFSADAALGGDGAWAAESRAIVALDGQAVEVDDLDALTALGRPFVLDGLAAAGTCVALGASPDAIGAAFRAFRPREHRVALVAEVDGVRYVDDSKATNPHAAAAAVRGMDRVVLLAGGRGKGLDLRPLADGRDHLRAVVAFGEAAADVEEAFEGSGVRVVRATDLRGAVDAARSIATVGDTVLLSPACASYDEFSGYADRGRTFAELVRARSGT